MNQYPQFSAIIKRTAALFGVILFVCGLYIPMVHATSLPINDTCLQLDRVLSFGKRGDDVKKLQAHLINFEYLTGNATGIFGTKTRAALKSLQADEGLSQTGKTEPKPERE